MPFLRPIVGLVDSRVAKELPFVAVRMAVPIKHFYLMSQTAATAIPLWTLSSL